MAPRRPQPAKPGFVAMVDPSLVDRPPIGPQWAHEIKWDGWRIQAHVAGGRSTLYTRRGLDWTVRFEALARAIAAQLAGRQVIMDGEAVALDKDGRPDFHALRRANVFLVYQAFDLLWLDGEDLRPLAWRERKRRLQELLDGSSKETPAITYVEALEADGPTMLASVCKLGLEGVVSKRVDAPYRAGRSDAWLKCRCAVVETVTVVGFSGAKRLNGIHVARAENGGLVYAGRIENGLSGDAVEQLEALLRPRVIASTPTLKKGRGFAVTPGVLVDISHRGVTAGGVMRHPRFERLRDDLKAS